MASLVAVVLAVLIAMAAAPGRHDAVQVGGAALSLWRDQLPKEVSGATLLGLAVAGLMLSLRKRWKFFGVGTVTMWRFAHAAIGVAMLAVLVVHTELRHGVNVNLALLVSFLGTAITGAFTGPIVALVKPSTPRARAIRFFFIGTHIVFFSALPVLIALHVFVVSYFGGR
jgi:nitrite reductase (NADH) large subunit